MNKNIALTTLGYFISISLFSQNNFTGDWQFKDQQSISGNLYSNGSPKAVNITTTPNSILIEKTTASGDGKDLTVTDTLKFDGKPFLSVYAKKKGALPMYYNGKLFIYDWVRGWIKAVTLDKQGNFSKMEPFMGKTKFNAPVDMELGPDGKLYVLEYGKGWYSKNEDAALSRIDFDSASQKLPSSSQIITKTGVDSAQFVTGHQKKTEAPGITMIKQSDCLTCHKMNDKSVGPAFNRVAAKYTNTPSNVDHLASKIINGGSGVWGDVPMPAHPALTNVQAHAIVEYIFTLKNAQ